MSTGSYFIKKPKSSAFVTAAYEYKKNSEIHSNGTGTLISLNNKAFIITAAHVLLDKTRKQPLWVSAELGSVNKEDMPILVRPKNNMLYTHPLYEEDGDGSYRNDIGLFEVSSKILNYIEPAVINFSLPKITETLYCRGWGAQNVDEYGQPTNFPNDLKEVQLKVYESRYSITKVKDVDTDIPVQSVMSGDSGGGCFNKAGELVCIISSRRPTQEELLEGPKVGAISNLIPLSYYEDWLRSF